MSSMVVGKYLIIKKVRFGDFTVVGGASNISPGTLMGDDSVTGAFTNTNYNQFIEPGWIYIGLPAMKYKQNKYAEERRDRIFKRVVEEETSIEIEHEVNIDEDKKELANNNNNKNIKE